MLKKGLVSGKQYVCLKLYSQFFFAEPLNKKLRNFVGKTELAFNVYIYLNTNKRRARIITLLPQAFPKILTKYNSLQKKLPYDLLEGFMKAKVATFSKNLNKNILTYAVIQILKIVLVNVKEMAYSPNNTFFTALDSTPAFEKTEKQLICISTLRNKLI